jgi:hypothetical protein
VSATGALIAAFSPALLDAATGRVPTGLAFDADNKILWAICSQRCGRTSSCASM